MGRFLPVGGQAVIEGVMMRSPGRVATAVRKPDGSIVLQDEAFTSITRRIPPLAWPVIRGAAVLVESMSLGVKSLGFAADQAAGEESGPGPAKPTSKAASGAALALTVAASLGLGVVVFFLLPLWLTGLFHLGSSIAFNAVDGAFRLAIFLLYIWGIGRWGEMQRVFEYHGAEHKTIHALESGVELTPENVQQFSRFHPRCGTSFLLIVMLMSILVFTFLGRPVTWGDRLVRLAYIPVIAGFSFELIRLSGRYSHVPWVAWLIRPGLDLQKLTTREPSLDQIEVSIRAMNAVWNEETSHMAPDAFLAAAAEGRG